MEKIEMMRKRERNGEQGERVFLLLRLLFLRRSLLHGMPAIPANQRPIKILK